MNAKVLSLKCSVYIVKKSNLDKILKENKDIYDNLMKRYKTKISFLEERLNKFLDFKSKSV